MPEEEKPKVRVELELPQDQVGIETEETAEGTKPKLVIHPPHTEHESPVKEATGYEVGELLAAPLKKPEPSKGHPARGQIRVLLLGFALIGMALISLALLGWRTAFAIALVGATFIAFGTLVRI